jgi:hypothetical protein
MAKAKIQTQYLITFAFPLQKWLRESTSILRHGFIASLVLSLLVIIPFQFAECGCSAVRDARASYFCKEAVS